MCVELFNLCGVVVMVEFGEFFRLFDEFGLVDYLMYWGEVNLWICLGIMVLELLDGMLDWDCFWI